MYLCAKFKRKIIRMSLFIVCRKPSGFKPEKEEDLLENPTQKYPNLEGLRLGRHRFCMSPVN